MSSLGDAKSSLGDAESSLGDAESSLGDAESSLGDAKSSLGDAMSSLGDATSSLGDAESSLGDSMSSLGDAKGSLGDTGIVICASDGGDGYGRHDVIRRLHVGRGARALCRCDKLVSLKRFRGAKVVYRVLPALAKPRPAPDCSVLYSRVRVRVSSLLNGARLTLLRCPRLQLRSARLS
jgi:hypothetical protein